MKLRFENFFRACLFVCVALLGWAFWANAQTNIAPIQIAEPKNGQRFNEGTNIVLAAELTAPEDSILRVEFSSDNRVIGVASNAPFQTLWTHVPAGLHRLAAKVTFNNGESKESAPVEISVHNALLTFGLNQIPFLKPPLWGIPRWQYIASLIYIFLAFYISKFFDYAIRVWLKKWAEKTSTQWDDLLLELVHGPVKVIAFVIFLHIGLVVFPWPIWVENILDKGFKVIVALSITYTSLKAVDMLMGYWKHRTQASEDRSIDEQLFPIVRKSLKLFIVVVAVLMTSQHLGLNITALLASVSVSALAIGLAAQDTLSNFFGAVVVFMDKPFRVGDRIKLAEADGVVESIGLRSTRVRSLDGYLITVPNKTMGNATITNISRRPTIKSEINYGITYDTSVEKLQRALAILDEVYKGHAMTHDVLISFNKFADSALNIQVVHWWKNTDAKAQLAGMQEMNLAVKKRFDAEGIGFAFPSQTVYLKQDSEWRVVNGEAAKPRA